MRAARQAELAGNFPVHMHLGDANLGARHQPSREDSRTAANPITRPREMHAGLDVRMHVRPVEGLTKHASMAVIGEACAGQLAGWSGGLSPVLRSEMRADSIQCAYSLRS